MTDQTTLKLGSQPVDYRVALYKSIVSNVPFVGGLLSEVISTTIPNQRLDRLEKFTQALEEKIADLDQQQTNSTFHDPEFVDLLEDGLSQVVRALSKERIKYIASLIKTSLTDQERRYLQYKKLLYILGELNDIEVMLLCGHSRLHDDEFWHDHLDVLVPAPTSMDSSQEELDDRAIHDAHKAHLVQLGLLKPSFKKPKKGQMPEFDEKTGMLKAERLTLTPLGALLLRCIDQGDRV